MTDRVQWSGGRREAFREFMFHELDRAQSARSTTESKWRQWQSDYRAHNEDATAHFPFEGASSWTVPVQAMNLDPVLANFMASKHAGETLWTLSPLNENWINTAKPMQDFLQWLALNILKMWDVDLRVTLEMLKLGTGVYKTSWLWESRATFGYDANQNRVRQQKTVNRPAVDHVSLADFLLPPEAISEDPDAQGGAQWVAERHRMRVPQLVAQAKGQEPFLPNYDPEGVKTVMGQFQNAQTDDKNEKDRLDRLASSASSFVDAREVEIWEIHARFDTTGSGIEEDIIVHYHKPTNTILRATYDWMGGRPYSVVRYFRSDGFYGIGIGEQSETFQSVISNVTNYSLDKLLLSNAPMWGVKDTANILPNEPIFPGKWIMLDDPSKDIVPLQMGSNPNFEMLQFLGFLQELSKGRSGVSDLQQGSINALPSRTPATTVQSLLAEGKSRFDLSIKDQRMAGLSEVGLNVLRQLQAQTQNFRNNPFANMYAAAAMRILGQPEGEAVAQALTAVPFEAIEEGVGVQLTASSGTNNKELMKQSKLALLQLVSQVAPGFIQLAQLITQDPGGPVGQTAMGFYQGGLHFLQQIMEDFDVRNVEDVTPNVQALLGSLSQVQGGGTISPFANQGGGQAPPQPGGFGGI